MSPQLPASRVRSEETPIDLSHARVPWSQLAAEDAWRVSPHPTSPPQIHIRVLSPPEAAAVAAANAAANSRSDPSFISHIRHKIKAAYRPLVDPVSPPRPPERSPSPSFNRPSPASQQAGVQAEPEVIHIQHQDMVRVCKYKLLDFIIFIYCNKSKLIAISL